MCWQFREIQVIVTSKTLKYQISTHTGSFQSCLSIVQSTLNKRYHPLARYSYTLQLLLLCDSKITAFLQLMSLKRFLILSYEFEKLYLSILSIFTTGCRIMFQHNPHSPFLRNVARLSRSARSLLDVYTMHCLSTTCNSVSQRFPRLDAHFWRSILLFYLSRCSKDTYNRDLMLCIAFPVFLCSVSQALHDN